MPGLLPTPEERERLQELEGAGARIANQRRDTYRQIARLRDAMTGHTHTITTLGYTLDFGWRPRFS